MITSSSPVWREMNTKNAESKRVFMVVLSAIASARKLRVSAGPTLNGTESPRKLPTCGCPEAEGIRLAWTSPAVTRRQYSASALAL